MNIFWLATCFFLCFKANGWDKSVSVPGSSSRRTPTAGGMRFTYATGANNRSMANA